MFHSLVLLCRGLFLNAAGTHEVLQDRSSNHESQLIANSSYTKSLMNFQAKVTQGIEGHELGYYYIPKRCYTDTSCKTLCDDKEGSALPKQVAKKLNLNNIQCLSSEKITIKSSDINSACMVLGNKEFDDKMGNGERAVDVLKNWVRDEIEVMENEKARRYTQFMVDIAKNSCYADGSTTPKPLTPVFYTQLGINYNGNYVRQYEVGGGLRDKGLKSDKAIFMGGVPITDFKNVKRESQKPNLLTGYDVLAGPLPEANRFFVEDYVAEITGEQGAILAVQNPGLFQVINWSDVLQNWTSPNKTNMKQNMELLPRLIENFGIPADISSWQDGNQAAFIAINPVNGNIYDVYMKVTRCEANFSITFLMKHKFEFVQIPIEDFTCGVPACYSGVNLFYACLPEEENVCSTPVVSVKQPYCATIVPPDYTCSIVNKGEVVSVSDATTSTLLGTVTVAADRKITSDNDVVELSRYLLSIVGAGNLFYGENGELNYLPFDSGIAIPVDFEFVGLCATWRISVTDCGGINKVRIATAEATSNVTTVSKVADVTDASLAAMESLANTTDVTTAEAGEVTEVDEAKATVAKIGIKTTAKK